MPKRLKNIFPQITDFQNLLAAARKAQKSKRYRECTLEFNFDLERNLLRAWPSQNPIEIISENESLKMWPST